MHARMLPIEFTLEVFYERLNTSINTVCSGFCFQWAASAVAGKEVKIPVYEVFFGIFVYIM